MKILFMCVANSARSQIAEGVARAVLPPRVEVLSAGLKPSHVNPFAGQVLSEIGIDISGAKSKSVEDIDTAGITHVITLCAEEVCPYFPGTMTRLHWPMPDPASASGRTELILGEFRRTRDELKERILNFYKDRT